MSPASVAIRHKSSQIPATILEVYMEACTGFSHMYVQMVFNTLFSKAASLKMTPTVGEHSKDRGRSEEPSSALVQLESQLAVVSSQ